MQRIFSWAEEQRDERGKLFLLYRHERIFEEGLVKPGIRALDVGGWGMLAKRIIEEGASCTILDIFGPDQYFPERVMALPHVRGSILDKELLPSLGSFDLITCFEVLEHLQEKELALQNIYRLLRPQGIFAGTVPIPGFSHEAGDPNTFFINREDLSTLLLRTGFQNLLVEPTPSILKGSHNSCLYFKAYRNL